MEVVYKGAVLMMGAGKRVFAPRMLGPHPLVIKGPEIKEGSIPLHMGSGGASNTLVMTGADWMMGVE